MTWEKIAKDQGGVLLFNIKSEMLAEALSRVDCPPLLTPSADSHCRVCIHWFASFFGRPPILPDESLFSEARDSKGGMIMLRSDNVVKAPLTLRVLALLSVAKEGTDGPSTRQTLSTDKGKNSPWPKYH